jgi:hypothetical protein
VHCLSGPVPITPNGIAADAAGNVIFSLSSLNVVSTTFAVFAPGGIIAAKISPNLALVWTRSFGGMELTAGGVAVDGLGNVVLGGVASAPVDLDGATITALGQAFAFELGP